nr:MAG TPA: hypothetical protein [Bacteriophage sp.]
MRKPSREGRRTSTKSFPVPSSGFGSPSDSRHRNAIRSAIGTTGCSKTGSYP